MFATQSSGAVNSVVNEAVNAVSDVASGAANVATSMFNSINNAANTAVNNVAKNVPMFNSLIPIGNNTSANANKQKNANANTYGNTNAKASNNIFSNILPLAPNAATNNSGKNAGISPWLNPLYIFIGIVAIFLIIFSAFNNQIMNGYEYLSESVKSALNYHASPDVNASVQPIMPVTIAPEAPQDITPKEQALPQPSQKSIVERLLPPTGQEVFNVAQNKFTYYDAEPLCRALGAELATYEQVKDAWGGGADWCNYGWVKGQMAIYPTQKETYDKLQSGPIDERNVCGTVGINGGYFDNPEFKYGVNCYGKKPSQSAHDQEQLMSEGKVPKSPETLKVDQMVAEFRDQADSLFVKPFSDEKWAST